jgi:hypothetical protein
MASVIGSGAYYGSYSGGGSTNSNEVSGSNATVK